MTPQRGATLTEPRGILEPLQGSPPDIDTSGGRGHVKDNQGRDIGVVHDVLIDTDERMVRFLLVEHHDPQGLTDPTTVMIPVDAITRIGVDGMYLDLPVERVVAAPCYRENLVNSRSYHDSIYSYYGYRPYWLAPRRPTQPTATPTSGLRHPTTGTGDEGTTSCSWG